MRTYLHLIPVFVLLCLNAQILPAQEQTNVDASIPIGKLAFVTSENFGTAGKIHFVSGNHRTTTLAFKTRELEFLPNGKQIIYSANDSEGDGIYLYDLKQHTSFLLLTHVPSAEDPSLSPDGTKIAFVQWPKNRKTSHIFTANPDGSGIQQLTGGQCYNWSPRWSPDGKQLVFETTRNDNPTNNVKNGGHRDVYLMDGDGQNQTNLTANSYGHQPSWSPDGKQIAYMSFGENHNANIFVMNADGSSRQNISHGSSHDSEPAWSPDGQWIAFTRTTKNSTNKEAMDIWIMKNDGTQQHPVTFNKNGFTSYSPSWSN